MSQDRQLKLFAFLLIVLGLCGFLFSFAISFQSLGLGQGLEIGDVALEHYRIHQGEGKNPFSGSVQNTHQRMASDYGAISISFLLIVVIAATQVLSKQLKQVAFPLISIASAAVGANFLHALVRDKTSVEDSFYESPRNEFVKLTITYDWVLLILAAAVVVGSLFLMFRAITIRPAR